MVYIGMIILSASVLFILGEYSGYMNKRLSVCEGFLLLIRHMRFEISCFSRPPCEICESFHSDALAEVGFLGALKNGMSPLDAYKSCRASLSLGKREAEIIERFFSEFGRGYLDASSVLAARSDEALQAEYLLLKEECPKRKKLAAALSACALLGIVILIV